jgi:single-stranded-DNA-specific exonuclease
VKRGLESLARTRNPGLLALLESAGCGGGDALSASDIGFRVAPRINAAGRMDHARDVVELFLTADEKRARAIALRLDELNGERQRAVELMVREILDTLGPDGPGPERAGLVFYSPDWHRGVVGIAANRLVELFHRPALVLGRDEKTGLAQGSGRSIPEFHLLDALQGIEDVFVRFGGHRQAVGVALEESRVDELSRRFNEQVLASLAGADLLPERELDAEARLEEINDGSAADVLNLAPFGLGNRAPLFLIRNLELRSAPEAFGREKDHLRLRLYSGENSLFAKAWRFAGRIEELRPGTRIDAAVSIDPDLFGAKRGYASWAATLKDVRPAES